MIRRTRLLAALVGVCSLGFVSTAEAYTTHDISGITLTETYSFISPFDYHVSSGTDGHVSFEWLDAPGKDTVIQAVRCTDNTELGHSNYSAGDTSYHDLFVGGASQCFNLRGRTQTGQGNMANAHGGRVRH